VQTPTGRGVYNVTCDSNDDTQLGWAYNSTSKMLTQKFKSAVPKCLDQSSDNRQIWVADCSSGLHPHRSQQWQFTRPDPRGYAVLQSLAHAINNVSVPGAQNSVGFARKGAHTQTLFRIEPTNGQLQVAPDPKTGALRA
jgi:hypothetical protein